MQLQQVPSVGSGSIRSEPLAWHQSLMIFLGVALLYFAAGWLGLRLIRQPEAVAVFWPAAGIAAGTMLTLGRRAYLPIALGVLAATIFANLLARSNPVAIAAFSMSNALECLIFAWVMEHLDKAGARLESLGSVTAFTVAALASCAIAAFPAALALHALDLSPASLLDVWLAWFKSDALGVIAVAPVLIALPSTWRNPPGLATAIEGVVGIAVTTVLASYAFGLLPGASAWIVLAPTTLLFPVFLWLAGRTPGLFSFLAALAVSVVIVLAAITGSMRPGETPMSLLDRLAAAQSSIVATIIAVLVLSAMFARLKNAARELQSSDERLRLALTAGRMYAFELDLESGTVRRTGGLIDRLGLARMGKIEEYLLALYPKDREIFEEMLLSLSPQSPRTMRKLRLRSPDGAPIIIEQRNEAIYLNNGRLQGIRGVCVDITAREAVQQTLEEREEQLRAALDAGRVYAYSYDVISDRAQRSSNAADILGLSSEVMQMSHNLFFRYVHPDDLEMLQGHLAKLTPSNPYASETFRFVRPDGLVVWLELTERGEFDAQGRLQFIHGLARDVTARKEAEEQQVKLIDELDHRVKNALARMAVVIARTREGQDNLDDYVAGLQGRIGSMARTQERLSKSLWVGVSVAEMVADELEPYRTLDNCTVEGPAVVLEPKPAQAFSFTLHELATNAAKHGALSSASGRVSVSWHIETSESGNLMLAFDWREQTEKPIEAPSRESYGLSTIRNLLRYEHQARINVGFTPYGVHCSILLPVRSLVGKLPAPVAEKRELGITAVAEATALQ